MRCPTLTALLLILIPWVVQAQSPQQRGLEIALESDRRDTGFGEEATQQEDAGPPAEESPATQAFADPNVAHVPEEAPEEPEEPGQDEPQDETHTPERLDG